MGISVCKVPRVTVDRLHAAGKHPYNNPLNTSSTVLIEAIKIITGREHRFECDTCIHLLLCRSGISIFEEI